MPLRRIAALHMYMRFRVVFTHLCVLRVYCHCTYLVAAEVIFALPVAICRTVQAIGGGARRGVPVGTMGDAISSVTT